MLNFRRAYVVCIHFENLCAGVVLSLCHSTAKLLAGGRASIVIVLSFFTTGVCFVFQFTIRRYSLYLKLLQYRKYGRLQRTWGCCLYDHHNVTKCSNQSYCCLCHFNMQLHFWGHVSPMATRYLCCRLLAHLTHKHKLNIRMDHTLFYFIFFQLIPTAAHGPHIYLAQFYLFIYLHLMQPSPGTGLCNPSVQPRWVGFLKFFFFFGQHAGSEGVIVLLWSVFGVSPCVMCCTAKYHSLVSETLWANLSTWSTLIETLKHLLHISDDQHTEIQGKTDFSNAYNTNCAVALICHNWWSDAEAKSSKSGKCRTVETARNQTLFIFSLWDNFVDSKMSGWHRSF